MKVLKLVNPCQRSWEELQGSDSVRYCEACATSVHDLDVLSPEELAALSQSRPGGFCGRSSRPAATGLAAILLIGAASACTSEKQRQPEQSATVAQAPRRVPKGPSASPPGVPPSGQPRMSREVCERLSALGGYMSVDCDDLPSEGEHR
jgi:hypothetical protein